MPIITRLEHDAHVLRMVSMASNHELSLTQLQYKQQYHKLICAKIMFSHDGVDGVIEYLRSIIDATEAEIANRDRS